jgi:hypothetical protein
MFAGVNDFSLSIFSDFFGLSPSTSSLQPFLKKETLVLTILRLFFAGNAAARID